MQKALASLVAIAAVFAMVTMYAQQKTPIKDQQGQSNQLLPAINETNNYVCQQEAKSGSDSPQGWHKFVTWPESWTAWAIILTLGAIAWQACLMRVHAGHLRALGEHIVTSDRAWFVCKASIAWERQSPSRLAGDVNFVYINTGQTPGFVTEIGFAIDVLEKDASLPDTPTGYETKDLQRWGGRGIPIAPQDNMGRRGSIETANEVQSGLSSGQLALWIHGYVRYRDVFQTEEHETRYCLRWNPQYANTGDVEFVIDGPQAYNSAT
jgi:hypothetical protein